MIWVWIILGLILMIVVAAIVYFLFVYAEAKLEVDSSPREPMFECIKHGFFRKVHLIKFLDIEYCPRCFDEKMNTALDASVIPEAFKSKSIQ